MKVKLYIFQIYTPRFTVFKY